MHIIMFFFLFQKYSSRESNKGHPRSNTHSHLENSKNHPKKKPPSHFIPPRFPPPSLPSSEHHRARPCYFAQSLVPFHRVLLDRKKKHTLTITIICGLYGGDADHTTHKLVVIFIYSQLPLLVVVVVWPSAKNGLICEFSHSSWLWQHEWHEFLHVGWGKNFNSNLRFLLIELSFWSGWTGRWRGGLFVVLRRRLENNIELEEYQNIFAS